MVAGLRNVDEDLAATVTDGLGLPQLPERLSPARPPIDNLAPSPALSTILNGPGSLSGRKLRVLVEGTEAAVLAALREEAAHRDVVVELVTRAVGGARLNDGSHTSADQKVEGGPSVLYDAVVVLASTVGAARLMRLPAAKDFVTDAYNHCKFIGYSPDAVAFFEACGITGSLDNGVLQVADGASIRRFLEDSAPFTVLGPSTSPRNKRVTGFDHPGRGTG
jgi:catalase